MDARRDLNNFLSLIEVRETMEHMQAMMGELAKLVTAYYKALIAEGLSEEVALNLCLAFQDKIQGGQQ